MLKKWLSYLLIAVIVMQSVGVMAGDDHQSHQDGEQHLELSNPQDSSNTVVESLIIEKSMVFNNTVPDCDHCCHCHNLCQIGVLYNSHFLEISLATQVAVEPHSGYLSKPYSPELRPPIV